MRYTFSDEEDSEDFPSRRSTRNSGISTPAEHAGPTVTASGRQVKSRLGGMYGETMLVDQRKEVENERAVAAAAAEDEQHDEEISLNGSARPQRSSRSRRAPRRIDEDDDDDSQDGDVSSGKEWSGNEDEPDDAEEFEADGEDEGDDDEEMLDGNDDEEDGAQGSLVVQLRYRKGGVLASNNGQLLTPPKVDGTMNLAGKEEPSTVSAGDDIHHKLAHDSNSLHTNGVSTQPILDEHSGATPQIPQIPQIPQSRNLERPADLVNQQPMDLQV